jgi:transketolase
MRWPFACALHDLAKRDQRVVLLMGDVGGGLFKDFARDYPDRYFNLGTAEQSMVGIAAGMALAGMRPVVYSFTPFILERAYEQLKLDVRHHDARVLLVGWCDETHGVTHASPQREELILGLGLLLLNPDRASEIPAMIADPDDWPAFLLLHEEPKQ